MSVLRDPGFLLQDVMMAGRLPSVCFAVLVTAAGVLCLTGARVDEAGSRFSDVTMDLGVVVSDLDASVAFYTQVVGLQKSGGFSVDEEFCRKAGLTDGHALDITVLTPNGDPDGTSLKLMQVPKAESRPADNSFVHSQLGFSYLTFFVHDIDAFMKRAEEHGAEMASTELVPLVGQQRLAVVRDPDGNLVEVIGDTSSE